MKSTMLFNALIIPTLFGLASANAFAAAKTAQPLTLEAVNNPVLPETADANAGTSAILRAQILLDRAHFSAGEIDGAFGSNMRRAIVAYQTSQKLEASGAMDAATWAALNKDDLPALTSYKIEAGRLISLPQGRENIYTEQADDHFVPRFQCKLDTGANNGRRIGAPHGRAAAHKRRAGHSVARGLRQ